MLAAILLTAASLGQVAPTPQRRMPPRLSDQVDASTFICIGTVDDVFTVHFPIDAGLGGFDSMTELPFARVRVERVLKGDPNTRVVFHEVWRTSDCDDTRATPGERSLFLLGRGVIASTRANEKDRAIRALGSELILRNVRSGDGIVPILREGEREYVVRTGWPDSLRGPDGATGLRFDAVVSWIETCVRFSRDRVTVHARCNKRIPLGSDDGDTFDLRILPDGSRRLARNFGEHEAVILDRLDHWRWSWLQFTLRREVQSDTRLFPDFDLSPARVLTVRIDDRNLEFAQGGNQDLEHADDAMKRALQPVLRTWAALWDMLDCPTCIDHRALDARILEAR